MVLQETRLWQFLPVSFALILVLVLSACASGVTQTVEALNDEQTEKVSAKAKLAAVVVDKGQPDPILPNLELDAQLLETLLITQLASFAGDWELASESALSAAKTTKDYRIARLAALLAMRAKNYSVSVEGAQLWLDLDQDSTDAGTALLLGQLGEGDVTAAYQGFVKRQSEQDIDDYIKEVSGVLVRQDSPDVAISISELYIEAYPESAQVALSSAYVAEKFKKEELVEAWLGRALLLKPNWDLAAQLKANLLRSQGKLQERSKYIKEYIDSNPKSVGMRINYAAELAVEKKYQDALKVMRGVISDDPKNVAGLVYAAALAQQLEDYNSAKNFYIKALQVDPSNDEVRWSIARIFVMDEKYQQAELYYQEISGRQYFFNAQLQVANMRYHTQGLKSAINALRRLEPQTENEYIDRATTRHYLLMQEKQYEEAFSAINETLAYLPENLELVYARALVAAELSELKTAEKDFRFILKQQPLHADAMNAFGYTLADQTDRYLEAKELITKALELQPKAPHILDSMGWVLFRLNDLDQAVKFLQQAYDLSSEVEIAAHLGEVLWVKGEKDRARDVWRNAFEKESKNPLLASTLRRFEVQLEGPGIDQVSVNAPAAK
ncbi:MAG: tetratricopeptide (TPR) repeat protein [Arenicella sp.]|jgi:tetratricopeptide (TPR) repeat protein